jgi:hypothetical protein
MTTTVLVRRRVRKHPEVIYTTTLINPGPSTEGTDYGSPWDKGKKQARVTSVPQAKATSVRAGEGDKRASGEGDECAGRRG